MNYFACVIPFKPFLKLDCISYCKSVKYIVIAYKINLYVLFKLLYFLYLHCFLNNTIFQPI